MPRPLIGAPHPALSPLARERVLTRRARVFTDGSQRNESEHESEMEGSDLFSNPVMELPTAVGATIIGIIFLLAVMRPRLGLLLLVASVPMQRFILIPGLLGDRFTPHEAAFLGFTASALIRRGVGVRLTAPWTGPIAAPVLALLSIGVMSLLGNPFIEAGIGELVILGYLYLLHHVIYDFADGEEHAFFAYRAWYLTGAGFALLAAYGALTHMGGVDTFLMDGPRLIVTFFNPNQAGSFLLATCFMLMEGATRKRTGRARKLINLGLCFCVVVGGYFMASRATMLGTAIGVIVFLILRRVRVSAIVAIGAVLIAGNVALQSFQQQDEKSAENYDARYSEGVDPGSQSAQVRIENWRTGIEAFSQSPVVGVGIGTLWLQTEPLYGMSYQVHNTYLSFLGETGALGFAALLAILLVVLRESILGMKRARGTKFEDPLTALIPSLCGMAVFNLFHYGIRARHLWVTMALVFAFRRLATRARAVPVVAAPPQPVGLPAPRGLGPAPLPSPSPSRLLS